MTIIKNERMSIVCRLGGFHTRMIHVMSFLGSIGKLMKDSGIEQLLEEVSICPQYSNSVEHILSGKAIARVSERTSGCNPH
jgi:hypothetical protein